MRRWIPVSGVVAVTVAVIGAAVVVGAQLGADRAAGPPVTAAGSDRAAPAGAAPRGWRWESYGGVQLIVPSTWGWREPPWCLPDRTPAPAVVRPGVVLQIHCNANDAPVKLRAPYVEFGAGPPGAESRTRVVGAGWTETKRILHAVTVTVYDNDPARARRILRSLQQVRALDAYGCPMTTPAIAGPAWRPSGAPLSAVGAAHVTVCRFGLPDPYAGKSLASPKPLISAVRLTGTAADGLANAMAAAPRGTGPDNPGECAAAIAYGEELMLVTVVTKSGSSLVVVRYSGCVGHGIDDGHQPRKLTRPIMQGLLTGPNFAPSDIHGNGVADLVAR